MKLVIVESPAKCKTIQKYLGDGYDVQASIGQIRDLATSGPGGLGVDVNNDFAPVYVINKKKKDKVDDLIKRAKKAEEVILATDPDREGEAIAWHLAITLGLDPKTTKRLEFHEITRESIEEAISHPRTIDMNLVQSQEARRILDRIIGFKISNILQKKIRSKSGGRVQSATLRIIADKEKEIANFVPEEYYEIKTSLMIDGKVVDVYLDSVNGKNPSIKDKKDAENIFEQIQDELVVDSVESKIVEKEAKAPFTTSTLQQEAFNRLKMSSKETMSVAQKLYEGIQLGDEIVGLITYMRTEGTALSDSFINRAKSFIGDTYGQEYIGTHAIKLPVAGAHEAVHQTSNHRTPEKVKGYLTPREFKLYELIYNHTLSFVMKRKKEETKTVYFKSGNLLFKADFSRAVFPGYDVLNEKKTLEFFPALKEGQLVKLNNKKIEQKFTQPPAHFNDARIVKAMEEYGIGRPSTYASTIDTLLKRKYTENKKGSVLITEQGNLTNDFLMEYFPDVINLEYTAKMEEQLDNIKFGLESKNKILSEFYGPFMKDVEETVKALKAKGNAGEKVGRLCPKCGHELIKRNGPNGEFVGCSNFPTCRFIEKNEVKIGRKCPTCGHDLVERHDARGNAFVGCSHYPKCKYTEYPETKETKEVNVIKIDKKCPKCGGDLLIKESKNKPFIGCSNFPKCHHAEVLTAEMKKKYLNKK